MRSTEQFAGLDRSLQRAWIKGAGFTDEELGQPLVLIANTYQDFSPENSHLRQVVYVVIGQHRRLLGKYRAVVSLLDAELAKSRP